MMTADCVKRYALQVDDDGHIVGEYSQDSVDPGVEIDRLTRKYMIEHGMDPEDAANYVRAYEAVKTDPANRALVRAYAVS